MKKSSTFEFMQALLLHCRVILLQTMPINQSMHGSRKTSRVRCAHQRQLPAPVISIVELRLLRE